MRGCATGEWRRAGRRAPRLGILIALPILLIRPAIAEPVRARVIEDVRVDGTGANLTVRVRVTFPFRYLSHFPAGKSDQLRIRIRPIAVSRIDRGAARRREAAPVPASGVGVLRSLIYEGGVLGGPIFTLQFQHPVSFSVRQGADSRSLIIVVSEGTEGHAPGPDADTGSAPND